MATQNNKKVLHRKEWQMMNPLPTSVAGSFIIKDPIGTKRTALYVTSATAQYLLGVDEDAYLTKPSFALAGTFGAGSCGAWGCWSGTFTANGGSTTTVTTTATFNGAVVGSTIRLLTGSQAGKDVTVTDVKIIPGGTSTVTFTPTLSGAIVNTDTFKFSTGSYYIWNAGTMATGSFKSYDPITNTITSLSITNAPATWGTDGRLVATPSYVGAYATGTATSGSATTLVNSAKTWTNDQWINYQVRITAGTGIGQVRTITDNDGTTLTFGTGATIDSTSEYAIEANDDFLYLLGNGAVTMYRYSISGNSWTTISPTVARVGTPTTGMSANWAGKTGSTVWADESAILDGQYIYSFAGGATTLNRYKISGGTNGAGAWEAITYINQGETFSTGSSYDMDGQQYYIRKDATHRYFYYDVVGNYLHPLANNTYPDGVALLGDKLFTVTYSAGTGDDTITWLYSLMNTGTVLHRIMIF